VQAEALCDVHAQSAGDPLAVAADEGVTAASAPPRCIAPTSTAPT